MSEKYLKLGLEIHLWFSSINLKRLGGWGCQCWVPGSTFWGTSWKEWWQRAWASPTSGWPSPKNCRQAQGRRIATGVLTLIVTSLPCQTLHLFATKVFVIAWVWQLHPRPYTEGVFSLWGAQRHEIPICTKISKQKSWFSLPTPTLGLSVWSAQQTLMKYSLKL